MKLSIHFSLAPGKASDLAIRMRVSYDGLRLDLRTGFVCPPDKWDASMMRVRAGSVNRYGEKASAINRALSKEESVVGEILARYELDGKVPEPAILKSDFERAMGRRPSKRRDSRAADGTSFLEVFRRYILEHGRDAALSSGSIGCYTGCMNRLSEYPFASKPVSEVSQRDLSDLINAMRDEEYENPTVARYIAIIKSVLRWARRCGLYAGTLPEDFRPKLSANGKKDVHYLEWSEFEAILGCEVVGGERVVTARDAFCFCCSTGLRISDCIKLRWRDVVLEAEVPHILVVAKKTSKPLVIELNKWSRLILDRQPHPAVPSSSDAVVFPAINKEYMNRTLPLIARAAGISGQVRELSFVGNRCTEQMVDKAEAITSHWGRHTFVVHALHLGISPDVIMSWTGHASYDSLRPYIAIANSTKAEKMSLFDG